MTDVKKLYEERDKRAKTAISLNEPDRVPFAPKIGRFYALNYGISSYEVMTDKRSILPGIRKFCEEFEPDLGWGPVEHNIPAASILGANFIKWPGPEFGIAPTDGFQVLDDSFIEDDEFEDFARDPGHFCMTKVYPRKFDALKGLSKLDFRNPFEYSIYSCFAAFNDPEVKSALEALNRASVGASQWLEYTGACSATLVECGVPVCSPTATNVPYDLFSDNIRGLLRCIMDMVERPDELLAAIDAIAYYSIPASIDLAKALGADYMFIPLHAGVDEFMSAENYEKFYWPGLQKLMLGLIDAGIIPYVFCEGKYNTRLEILRDVPKGKAVYMFEECDMKQAKKILGDTACINGNLPTALLAYGKKQEVVDKTKELLDICAPGGGFIMDVSIVVDNAKPENMEAMRETTLTYGKY